MDLQRQFDDFTRRDWQTTEEDVDPIRIAMIGVGWWTREEAIPAVEKADLCETAVLVSSSESKAESVAEENDIEHGVTYEEYHDGAASDAYDAVYVCTPNATHDEYVETAAELGKAVLVEKPMAATVEGAERIVDTCEEAGVPLMVAYRMHTEPAVRRARELLREGFIGDVVHLHGHMSDPLLDIVPDRDQWRLNEALSGGCTLMDIGIYPLNTARFLLEEDPVRVDGQTVTHHPAFEGTDERVSFRLDFPEGVTAMCTASHNSHQSSYVRCTGTEGELRIEPAFFPWQDRKLTLSRDGTTNTVEFEQANQMTEEFDYFADCLLSDRDPHPDGQHGLTDLEAIEAIYETATRESGIEL